MKRAMIDNQRDTEKVLLVIVDFKGKNAHWTIEENLKELKELIVACGGEVVDHIVCSTQRPTAGYLISENKVKSIAQICNINDVDTVIFSQDLKGSQH